ncbi:KIN14B-interacting protein [Populus alba x Populus x berolinensis]|uniref:KIN14B-interacting protein n=1 Tax=Populus alba x Populus x berolinensis TaxID=444605 RepID=A0AAD6MAM8_9ROSI|nr:KIN14B-interacting protein [Populus alba x Populus x berolinensis]
MSASSARRLKGRNGVADSTAAPKPTKALTPISISDKNPNSTIKRSLSGKENPARSNSRAQKPAIRPVPRVDKAAVGYGSEGRMRRSTSLAPRGRSPSPSEFVRVFRDSRVSTGGNDNRVVSRAEKSGIRGMKENGGFSGELKKRNGLCKGNDLKILESKKQLRGLKVLNDNCNKEVNLRKSREFDSNLDSKVANGGKFVKVYVDKSGSEVKFDSFKDSSEKSYSKGMVSENLKEKGLSDEGKGSNVGVKYPSKLHEKLAFLEGKVKRIASDIKKTKEMLDMNNPDASKVILLNIQDKISGIEKAIGNDAGSSSSKSSGNDTGTIVVVEKNEVEKVENVKSQAKGLNTEELEERLIPHHKLLRNRTSLKAPMASCQSHNVSNADEYSCELKVEEKLSSPIEENPIALEFLDSLSKEDGKVIVRDAKVDLESFEVQEMGDGSASGNQDSSNMFNPKCEEDLLLTTDETLDEFDDQENRNTFIIGEETEDTCVYQVNEIGTKSSTGGWFVSEGESVLTHDDGSCSFYDIANCEEKAVYKPPAGVSPNIWRDCWIIRAPGADGCSGRYVVAASAGNTLDSGFCSWDFYAKDVRAFHIEDGGTTASRTVLGPLPNNTTSRRNALSSILLPETQQWWYKPCGPLMVSTASSQKVVKIHDIRDGEQIMKWEVQKPVLAMDYSSPLQWRNKGKVVVAEAETISVWDVNSLNPQPLLSVSLAGRKISALHVINTDAELGGGVRQRATSAEAEGNDGVFCTPDSINVLDFRNPSGIGLKIPKIGVSVQSVFTRGDSIYIGCANTRLAGKKHPCSQVQHFSLRKQRLVNTYSLPESNAYSHHSAITQVWGNSNLVMGVCGLGLFAFDALKDDALQSFTGDISSTQKVKDVIGPDDLYSPSFDYLASCALLISRDRPALWKHLL